MKDEIIESIFGCLERIEEKLNKQPVQNEQGENENNGDLAEVLLPLVDSVNRTSRNLCVLRDTLKIISDRQKKDKEELLATVKQGIQTYKLKHDILEQLSKPQHGKVTHDLTTNTWWLVGVGTILFFLIFFLTIKIYNQSQEIEGLQLAGWKYRALRATLPANNVNVIWLERNVWAGNKEGIRHCQQFVINYEDSVRRRHQMEVAVQQREQEGQRLMRESDSIRKKLK